MEILNKPGIYLIFNLANQRVYVGQSKNVKVRLQKHKSYLKRSCHVNQYLQNAFNHYGEDKFVFRSVEYCEVENLMIREQYWIDQFSSTNQNRGYNLRPASKHESPSKETRAKMSEAQKGKTLSEEHRAKIGASQKGKIISEESRLKMKEAHKGVPLDKERCLKISASNKGKTRSEETKAKMSASRKGIIYSEETRARMAEAQKIVWARKKDLNL